VTIELPYDRASVATGIKESALTIHAWNPDARAWESLASTVDPVHQIVRAQTRQFSFYHIMATKAPN
jgi:hypothetical protein